MKLLRRIFSSLLLALFSFSLISPLVFSAEEKALPACCRKAGKHHCGMSEPSGSHDSGGVQLRGSGRCPLYPLASGPVTQAFGNTPVHRQTFPVDLVSELIGQVRNEAGYRHSLARSRQERGPPPNSLLFV